MCGMTYPQKSLKDRKNAVPECWDLFEEILKYCKLMVEKYSPDYKDPDKMSGLHWKSADE